MCGCACLCVKVFLSEHKILAHEFSSTGESSSITIHLHIKRLVFLILLPILFFILYYLCVLLRRMFPLKQLTFESKIKHTCKLQRWKMRTASGTYSKLRVFYHAFYKKRFRFVSQYLFLSGQDPLEGWLVSASGNNAFKVDFIRWAKTFLRLL